MDAGCRDQWWGWRVPCPCTRREATGGTLLLTTCGRCGPSSSCPPSNGFGAGLGGLPCGLGPLEAGAEPLEEDGDDADHECRAIQACLHLTDLLVVRSPHPAESRT